MMLKPNLFRLLVLPAVLALAMIGRAPAQPITIEIAGATEAAIPIAVVPFHVLGNAAPPQDVAAIIAGNLQRSGMFEPLASSDMLSRPARMEDV